MIANALMRVSGGRGRISHLVSSAGGGQTDCIAVQSSGRRERSERASARSLPEPAGSHCRPQRHPGASRCAAEDAGTGWERTQTAAGERREIDVLRERESSAEMIVWCLVSFRSAWTDSERPRQTGSGTSPPSRSACRRCSRNWARVSCADLSWRQSCTTHRRWVSVFTLGSCHFTEM